MSKGRLEGVEIRPMKEEEVQRRLFLGIGIGFHMSQNHDDKVFVDEISLFS